MRLTLAIVLLVGCGEPPPSGDAGVPACRLEAPESITVERVEGCTFDLHFSEPHVIQLSASGGSFVVERSLVDAFGPARLELPLRIGVPVPGVVRVTDLGVALDDVDRSRSLVWTDPTLLSEIDWIGFRQTMEAVAPRRAETVLDAWFRRFASTAHSERLGPQRLLDEAIARDGGLNLDTLPFVVTGVHNRLDLRTDEHCGEMRISMASTDPILSPFHLIFLFRQEPLEDDYGPDGSLTCAATAHRWGRLSELEYNEFLLAARAFHREQLANDSFLMAETLEFIISPWEWRQWVLDSGALQNPPLFQTLNVPRINAPGPLRDTFLAWVRSEAPAIDARTAVIPLELRPPSARVNDGVPWIPVDLTGLEDLTTSYPNLRQNLEIVGCPACHATDADFVQTEPGGRFSPFYEAELPARAEYLIATSEGRPYPVPFGPLQANPVLPP